MATIISAGPGAADLSRQILEHQAPNYEFSFSPFLLKTYRFGLDSNRPVCKAFLQGHCPLGNDCPDKHTSQGTFGNNLVCKHWLRGLCKKGEGCEFLHEYNLRKMPECNFFLRNGYCPNGDECLYLHVDPASKLPPCPHYERGFCPLGPRCSKKHIRKQLCKFYLCGFCPNGKGCPEGVHAKWTSEDKMEKPTVAIIRDPAEIAEEQAKLREAGERREEEERERFGGGFQGGRGGRWGGHGGRGRGDRRGGRGRH